MVKNDNSKKVDIIEMGTISKGPLLNTGHKHEIILRTLLDLILCLVLDYNTSYINQVLYGCSIR